MHLLDLGMNTGAVRFYSQWLSKGCCDKINNVVRTNISFYFFVATLNTIGLLFLAFFGESFFSLNNNQFIQLRNCLIILAIFSFLSWSATSFNQLLIAGKQIKFTMQIQSIIALGKLLLVLSTIKFQISLTTYFCLLTILLSVCVFPYAWKCLKNNMVSIIKPGFFWDDFKEVFLFSLSIFALSLFQMTATQSRSIVLSIFALNGADSVAEFRIVEVIPQLIIMIGGTFTSIFLPKVSEMVTRGNQGEIENFAYKWTMLTSILACFLCFPFILSSKEILSIYVGSEYTFLAKWLILWCIITLTQIHTTPGNAMILAYGKTSLMVKTTAIACIISIFINSFLAPKIGVGSAIVGYGLYVAMVISLNYAYYYKKLMKLDQKKMLLSFFKPFFWGAACYLIIAQLPVPKLQLINNEKTSYLLVICIRTLLWSCGYAFLLSFLKIVNWKRLLANSEK